MKSINGQLDILKRNSRAKVMLAVREHGPVSRVQLARITGLSLACVGRMVKELIVDGELKEVGTVPTTRGRPMVLVDMNIDGSPIAGVWIGPESIEIAVASSKAEILARRQILYDWELDRSDLAVNAIIQGIKWCVEAIGKDMSEVKGVGITVAGYADSLIGVIEYIMHRQGWEGVPIVKLIQAELNVPTYVAGDIRGLTIYHHWFSGQGRDGGSAYVIAIEGLGANFVFNRELLYGSHDLAGSVGHISLDPDGPQCPCGSRGCLELFASDLAFIRNVWHSEARRTADITASERVELVRRGLEMAKQGDPLAVQALQSVAKYLGLAVANIVRMVDPRTVFMCGTLIDCEPGFVVDMIRREAMKLIAPRTRGVDIVALPGFEDYLLLGAIGLVMWQPLRALQQKASDMSAGPVRSKHSLQWAVAGRGSS